MGVTISGGYKLDAICFASASMNVLHHRTAHARCPVHRDLAQPPPEGAAAQQLAKARLLPRQRRNIAEHRIINRIISRGIAPSRREDQSRSRRPCLLGAAQRGFRL